MGFVHRHGKSWFHGELPPGPFERVLSNFGKHHNSGNQDRSVSSGDFALQDFVIIGRDVYQLGAIAEAFPWIEVSEEY